MANIKISRTTINPDQDPMRFEVEIEDEKSSKSKHIITLTKEFYTRIAGGLRTPEDLVRASVEFLLEREGKESILPSFDLSEIQRYFPEYENLISARFFQ